MFALPCGYLLRAHQISLWHFVPSVMAVAQAARQGCWETGSSSSGGGRWPKIICSGETGAEGVRDTQTRHDSGAEQAADSSNSSIIACYKVLHAEHSAAHSWAQTVRLTYIDSWLNLLGCASPHSCCPQNLDSSSKAFQGCPRRKTGPKKHRGEGRERPSRTRAVSGASVVCCSCAANAPCCSTLRPHHPTCTGALHRLTHMAAQRLSAR